MNSLCLERFRQLVETFDIIGYRKATAEDVWVGGDGSTITGIESQREHFILRRREPGEIAASMVCAKCQHWASSHGMAGCRARISSGTPGEGYERTCGCLETFPIATLQTKEPAANPQPPTVEQQIRNQNRAACEQTLGRSMWTTNHVCGLEPIRRDKLSDTPFEIIGALVWAYRALDSRDAEIEQLKQDRDSPQGTEAHLARMAGEYQRSLSEMREPLKKWSAEARDVRRENDHLKDRQKKLERVAKAISEFRYWFDTCTKTQIEGWEGKAAAASEELDAARAELGGPDVSLAPGASPEPEGEDRMPAVCSECQGTGRVALRPLGEVKGCPACDGSGSAYVQAQIANAHREDCHI